MKENNENKKVDKKAKKKSGFGKILIGIIVILLCMIGVVVFAISREFNKSIKQEFETVDTSGKENERLKNMKTLNIMLLGMEDVRTDMIMVASYNPQRKDLAIISVPRDSYIDNGAYDPTLHKINAVYANPKVDGGVQRVAEQVSRILGIPINDYIMVDYNGVRNIVDAVGGVDVNIPFNMKYDDPSAKPPLHIYFEQGPTTVMGDQAVEYLRWRKNNYGLRGSEGDIGRIKRQQEFVVKAIEKSLDPTKIAKVVDVAFDNVKTSLNLTDVLMLAKDAVSMDKENIKTYQTIGTSSYFNGLWYFLNEDEKNQDFMEKIINGETILEEDLQPSNAFLAKAESKSYTNTTGTFKKPIKRRDEQVIQTYVEEPPHENPIFGEAVQEPKKETQTDATNPNNTQENQNANPQGQNNTQENQNTNPQGQNNTGSTNDPASSVFNENNNNTNNNNTTNPTPEQTSPDPQVVPEQPAPQPAPQQPQPAPQPAPQQPQPAPQPAPQQPQPAPQPAPSAPQEGIF